MGFFDSIKNDFKNFWKWMPNEVKIFEDKENRIEALDMTNPPNPYTPQRIRYYEDKKKGIFVFHTEKFKTAEIPEDVEKLPLKVKKLIGDEK